jgi:hypothetical protein
MSEVIVDPILHVGVDIGIKRDSSAIAAIYHDYGTGLFKMWGIKIFTPPVNMITQVEPILERLLKEHRIACIYYDPSQFLTTQQRLVEAGWGAMLEEVNQLTMMTTACSTLKSHCDERTFLPVLDPDLRAHLINTAVKETERGPRLIKSQQSRPVDATVATAMALMGATGSSAHIYHPSFTPTLHARSAMVLP